MDELAAGAGLSKRTLYRYFRSKDEIIEATLDNLIAKLAAEIEGFLSARPKPAAIIAYIIQTMYQLGSDIVNPLILADLLQHYPHYWKKIDDFRIRKAQDIITSILDARNKTYTRELDPRIVTAAVLASIQAVVNPGFIISNGLTLEKTMSQLLDFFQYGFMKQE